MALRSNTHKLLAVSFTRRWLPRECRVLAAQELKMELKHVSPAVRRFRQILLWREASHRADLG